jgi:hypothetical protein
VGKVVAKNENSMHPSCNTFLGHLTLPKKQYCHPRVAINNGVMCPTLLDRWFEIESTFVLVVTMKKDCTFALLPPFNCNPTS